MCVITVLKQRYCHTETFITVPPEQLRLQKSHKFIARRRCTAAAGGLAFLPTCSLRSLFVCWDFYRAVRSTTERKICTGLRSETMTRHANIANVCFINHFLVRKHCVLSVSFTNVAPDAGWRTGARVKGLINIQRAGDSLSEDQDQRGSCWRRFACERCTFRSSLDDWTRCLVRVM